MIKSQIFHTTQYKAIQKKVVSVLNSQADFLSPRTATSTRAVGDAVQAILSESFPVILGDLNRGYSAEFARRSMADLVFTDEDGLYYVVDVKTHRLETHFNMPNLTSVERLARFYEDDRNYFIVLMVKYTITGTRVRVHSAHFLPIEFLSWNCLTLEPLAGGKYRLPTQTLSRSTRAIRERNG